MKRKRRAGSCEENRDPGEDLRRNLKRELRLFSQSGAKTRNTVKSAAGSGLGSGGEILSRRPEVKIALIRKSRIQTSVQTWVHTAGLRGSELASICADQNDPRSNDPQLSQRRTWVRKTRVTSRSQTRSKFHVKPRSTAGPQGVVSDQSRTRKKRAERGQDPDSYRGESGKSRIRPESKRRRTETRIRRRRKIHPSVFRGRGQLRLSITAEEGQLIVYIHEARGLMGTTQRSCDSYVTLAVTSDPNNSSTMKTPPVLNTKNPNYNQIFRMCVTDDLAQQRLLVSVFGSMMTSEVKPRPLCPNPSDHSQLIGCMSFGIGSLSTSSKLVRGWFYILAEDFGRSKHLRVMSQPNKPMRTFQDAPALCADLRRTPDSTSDPDLNHILPAGTTSNLPNRPAGHGLKDLTNHRLTSRQSRSLDFTATQRPAPPDCSSQQQLTVSVTRGKDGFGFTICSDCPVRVQAVDSGGPAHQSGLRQGDSVLQLNGLPVETWKCVDLAHAIRSCPSHIVLVVWRGLPELRSGCEALFCPPTHNMTSGRKLLPAPAHGKHGRRQGHGSKVRSSFGALGSLWRDRKENHEEEEEVEEEEVTEYSPCTTTLKGTRVTSSQGDNYIILSPVTPGGQLLQPVYQDRNRTIGRLYQTHPSKGQNLLLDSQPGESQQVFTGRTSTLPPRSCTSTSSSSTPPNNYGNYQNCTIVQSHLPCSSYGTYVTLAPKTLIFPVFVQPLDLCSPDRTLLMAEEMVLHQADLLPAKVTVLIYNDLMLFTREDEAGRCNVLQSPLYLNTLQLREVPAAPLQIYFLQSSQGCWRCLFSLEALSVEQKVRVSLCLHDNIQLQLVPTETRHTHQFSDLPSDFGLLSLHQSDLLYPPPYLYSSSDSPFLRPSSPYSSFCDSVTPPCPYSPSSPFSSSTPPSSFSTLPPHTSCSPPSKTFITPSQLLPPPPSSANTQRSPVWKERAEEEVEVRQQGEGESASETSESGGGFGRRNLLLTHLHFNMKKEESDEYEEEAEGGGAEEFTYRPAVLQRSLSEGSLLQEPRSPRFLSDSTIHQLTRPSTSDLDQDPGRGPPSIDTLRKELTREGGSLHHMLLLLNNNKDAEFRNLQLRKKTKSLAADVRSRLQFLRQRKNSSCFHGNSLEKALRNNRPSKGEVLRWAENLEALLRNQYGLAVFRHFLRSEFSEENLDFWLAVERFKRTRPLSKMTAKAVKIYDEFISTNAARQVNVDSSVRESTNHSLCLGVSPALFQLAQDQIFGLMETDSYPRFLKSALYTQLANQGAQAATELSS